MLDRPALLDRLNFSLPPFVRQQWASELSRERWQPRINAARKAYQSLEIASVAGGVRRAARRIIPPARLESVANEIAPLGLTVTPIANVVPNRAGYRARLEYAKANEPFDVSCVIARNDDSRAFLEASRAHDDDTIGELLGIPACCRAFFSEVWHRQRMIDTTWPMALASSTVQDIMDNSIIISAEPETNVMLRWLGIRLVPHLPCSFQCRESIRLARRLAEVAIREGHGAGVAGAWEILSWPMEWSALHGIAEVRTPIFKIAVDTDATGRHYRVQLRATRYPEDAERGLRFPYLDVNAPKKGGQLEHALVQLRGPENFEDAERGLRFPYLDVNDQNDGRKLEHAENGFPNASAMIFAHLKLLNVLDPIIDALDGSIADLGCGTGELLRSLGAGKKNVKLYGVDRDERKISRARAKLGLDAKLYAGNYLDENGPWLDERHALIVGTLALAESEERLNTCLRMISRTPIAVFYYYTGYRGDIAECVSRLEMVANSIIGKTLTQIGGQCWAIHDKNASLPSFHQSHFSTKFREI
jgi:hypothetical protein